MHLGVEYYTIELMIDVLYKNKINDLIWLGIILILVVFISLLHYLTPTMLWQYHLIYMQGYFIPILIAAFRFGLRGGIGTALLISIIYLPHIMLQWGGFVETNLMRFLQIVLFNVFGFIIGYLAQSEKREIERYQTVASKLEENLEQLKAQSEKIQALEEQLRTNDRLAIVGELTASLAHEVRNPLGSIRGAAEIIRHEENEKRREEFYKVLVEETSRLSSVLETYLSYSKKQKQPSSQYIIQEIIQNIVMMLNSSAKKSNIEIKVIVPDENIVINGDPNDLWQILMNVVLNSIQAISDSGTIHIETNIADRSSDDIPKEFKSENDKDYIIISIKDDGPGMAESELQNIYKPFFTTKTDGTGLGMAIVKRIADNNHWYINIESNLGSGTNFVLYITDMHHIQQK